MPNFQIDIFAEMDGSQSEEDKHSDSDDSGQEIDDFIKGEKSNVKKTKVQIQKFKYFWTTFLLLFYYFWTTFLLLFKYFCKEMTNSEFNIGKVPVPELDKLPERQLALL